MPPKKAMKIHGNNVSLGNPRVILGPLRADSSTRTSTRFATLPPSAALFKKPELSDLKLKVGDNRFYAHRLIMCAGSEVFHRMLGSSKWAESSMQELELQEEEECIKVFERFLYYFYSGTITITDADVIPLFILADKYNVKPLYNECVEAIEDGLKVYTVLKNSPPKGSSISINNGASTSHGAVPGTSGSYEPLPISSSSSYSDSSDSESSDSNSVGPNQSAGVMVVPQMGRESSSSRKNKQTTTHLIASETFPLSLVMKMLMYCHNNRIAGAALYNLEARLARHIIHNNFGVWNDLDLGLLVRMLKDKFFYCNEYILFKAAKSWLTYCEARQTEEVMASVLCCIRYPRLEPEELYEVERDEMIRSCPAALEAVNTAIRYRLFRSCSNAALQENWTGQQYEPRQVKHLT